MSRGKLNIRWAAALVEGLANAGVEQAVLSPGSRCTPLTIACETYLNTKIMVDERSAAFYALGLAKITCQPVVLVCTSGSAVANWYPAVVEASLGRVPLILLSADRPPELLGFGANQTIDQIKIFQNFVRAQFALPSAEHLALPALSSLAAKAIEHSLWPLPGPVHINVPFREPLLSNQDLVLESTGHGKIDRFVPPLLTPNISLINNLATRITGHPGCIVCGELPNDITLAEAITNLAAALDCPILADPLSNLRRGEHNRSSILCHYDAWLMRPKLFDWWGPQWLIRFGTMPVSKRLHKILVTAKIGLQVIVDDQGNWADPQHTATLMVRSDPTVFCNELMKIVKMPKSGVWRQVLGPLERLAAVLLTEPSIPLEWAIIQELVMELPANANIFIGNSMPVRDLDACLNSNAKPLNIIANRGASGIDGCISTLAGIAAGSKEATIGMIGDLALFHDLNGLHALRNSNVILIVTNNGGGGIFHYLSQARLSNFEKNWLTPTELNISAAATLFNLKYQKINSRTAFATAIKTGLAQGGVWILEVTIDTEYSVTQHRAYWNAVVNYVKTSLQ